MTLKTTLIAGVAALAAGPTLADDWPDLPVGIKNGIGVRLDDRLIVGLGSAGAELFALDLANRETGWQPISPFAGPAPSQPAAAVSGGRLYIFSGSGLATPDAAAPTVFDTVHRYDPVTATIRSPTPGSRSTPRRPWGSSAPAPSRSRTGASPSSAATTRNSSTSTSPRSRR